MGGGLLQLVAKGAQDVYLINDPQITLFKNIFHRYTNFSYETFQLNFDGNKKFGQEINCTIPLNGDLLSKAYLVIILNEDTSKKWGYVEKIGFNIINQISISINGQTIDSQTGEWLNIYHQLHKNKGKDNSFNILNGNVPEMKKINVDHPKYTLYIPLQFWFCHHYGLSIPVIALEKNSIEIKVKLNEAINCINYKDSNNNYYPSIKDIHLLVDYIYLDNIERNKFIKKNHEYLINQVQINEEKIPSYKHSYQLKFFHPSKYLIWLSDQSKYNSRNEYLNWNFNNNWEETKNDFAKLIWLSTRSGLNNAGTLINYSPDFYNIGDNPELIENGNEILEKLSKKVIAELLFYDSDNNAEAKLNNVNLTKNDITYEDMSITIKTIKDDLNTTTAQSNFLDLHKVSIISKFNYGNYVNGSDNPIVSSQLKLNGQERFSKRDSLFFNYIQPKNHFNNIPNDGINIYNFSLNPKELQPSGSCNFSRVDNTTLELTIGNNNSDNLGSYFKNNFKSGNIRFYTNNYNLLKISKMKAIITYES